MGGAAPEQGGTYVPPILALPFLSVADSSVLGPSSRYDQRLGIGPCRGWAVWTYTAMPRDSRRMTTTTTRLRHRRPVFPLEHQRLLDSGILKST